MKAEEFEEEADELLLVIPLSSRAELSLILWKNELLSTIQLKLIKKLIFHTYTRHVSLVLALKIINDFFHACTWLVIRVHLIDEKNVQF